LLNNKKFKYSGFYLGNLERKVEEHEP